ncbi:MAG: hypothetical protein MJB57_15415 [Gemmatimonadetes bacterium]|nr:hypothetical protein [Gemmatimonadota bacterium]
MFPIVVLATVALVVANGILLRRNVDLVVRVEALQQNRTRSMVLEVGATLPDLNGIGLDNRPISITYPDTRETIFFIFSTTCPLCDANWPYWHALEGRVDRSRFRVVYANLSDEMSEAYARQHSFGLDAPVVSKVDPQSSLDYKLSLTPLLVLADENGVVRSVWPGITRDEARQEIESAFGVSLGDVTLAVEETG